jgi:dipeptidyl aminopeptidase/acylaminoacyl peptidase
MGKPGILLLYPREDHSLMEENNQRDLSAKVLEWFDYHLKDCSKPHWTE